MRRQNTANNSNATGTEPNAETRTEPNAETNVPGETPLDGACGESEVKTNRGLGAASPTNLTPKNAQKER